MLGALLVFLLFVQGGNSLIFCLGKTEEHRKMMVNSTGRKWEFTFTTLVTFGGAFFASFPLFYSTSFGDAYWLWMIILFSFVLQAVSYEFQSKAGNLLGKLQHGHMEAVGYDLYCKMLNEAVKGLKGIPTIEDFTTVVDMDVDAYIPAEYIVNEVQKLDIYKRIAGIENERERDDMKDELLDRFGAIPKSVENLLRIALIRVRAHSLYMTEIKGKNERITFTFRPDAPIDPLSIPELLKAHRDRLLFTAYGTPYFTWKYRRTGLVEKDAELLLNDTETLLAEMADILKTIDPAGSAPKSTD